MENFFFALDGSTELRGFAITRSMMVRIQAENLQSAWLQIGARAGLMSREDFNVHMIQLVKFEG
jgi:hypothetical protein